VALLTGYVILGCTAARGGAKKDEGPGFLLAAVSKVLAHQAWVPIAGVSYSGYLLQYVFEESLKDSWWPADETWAAVGELLATTFLVAWGGAYLALVIERPFIKLGRLAEGGAPARRAEPAAAATKLALLALLAGAALLYLYLVTPSFGVAGGGGSGPPPAPADPAPPPPPAR